MAELPAGTVTLLFTDIEGSTRLVAALRDRYVDALASHDQLLRDAARQHGGIEIDTQGDAFFFAFPRAINAVKSAIDGQRALGAHEWPDGQAVRVRMGIHTGEPIVGGDRYVGLGVHRASRISSAGHGGQILISNVTRQLIEDELPTGVELRDLGEHQLKDMKRPERLFQVVTEGLPTDFPPLRAAEAIPESPFAGREAELATAAQAAVPRLRRRTVVITALALLAAIGLAMAFAVANRGPSLAEGAPQDHIALIDPRLAELTDAIRVGSNPGPISVGEDALWVANLRDRTLSRVDLETRDVRTVGLGFAPNDLTVGHGFVWVSDAADGQIFQLNTFDGRLERTFDVGVGGVSPIAVTVSEDAVWAANSNALQVVRIDPASNATTAIPLENLPQAISVGSAGEGIWVVEGGDAVVEINPATNSPGVRIATGFEAGGIAVGAGSVWVSDPNVANTVWRIDPQARRLTRSIEVGRVPRTVAFAAEAIWVANTFDGTVSRIDPQTDTVTHTIRVGREPSGIAVGEDAVWVAIGTP